VSLALRFSICLNRNGRSEVEPVMVVVASLMSEAIMVFLSCCMALDSASSTISIERVLSLFRRVVIALFPTRSLE